MALHGISTTNEHGDILDRLQYDAKAGKWHRVSRTQNAAGEWISDMIELDKGDMFVADLPNIEVGWIAFASTGPDFQMVPNGTAVPPRPSENHKTGFRMRVLLPKEDAPRTFASTAKNVIGVIDELHTKATADAPAGQVPVLRIAGTRVVETKGKMGTTRNYAPLLEIVKYAPRPAALGEAPAKPAAAAPASPQAATPTAKVLEDEVPF
jgi:hypothetical protein